MMVIYLKLITLFCFIIASDGDLHKSKQQLYSSRQKRYLPFLGNSMTFLIGIGVPLIVHRHTVIVGLAARVTYDLPTNISELGSFDQRKRRALSRWDIYKLLEQDSEMQGHGGRSCILKSICEASNAPLDKYNGLFEEFIHTLFTPTTTSEDIRHHTDNEYYAAHKLGKIYNNKCKQFFPECKHTLLEMLTVSYPDY